MGRALHLALLLAGLAALGACTFPSVDYGDGGAGGSCPGLDACTAAAGSCAATAQQQRSACQQQCKMANPGCISKCDATANTALTSCDATCSSCAPPGCAGAPAACKTAAGL